jgi:VCBS repeat-containing protein
MNTPQAVDDYKAAYEDGIFTFDVMANDLGGSAKILWSIDDTTMTDDSGSGAIDLLTRDGTTTSIPEYSDLGARIWIENGIVKYDSNPIDYLSSGEQVVDKFTYAIRLSNGTLSWATVYVTLTGTNDAVYITSATAAGAVVEDSAQTPSSTDSNLATGTISFTDQDLADNHTATFVPDLSNTTTLGTFALSSINEAPNAANGSVGWTYTIDETAAQYLAAGEVKNEKFIVTINDGNGSTTTQTIIVTITGTNDQPDIRAALGDTASASLNETDSGLTTSGTLTVTDIDTADTVSTSVDLTTITGSTGGQTNAQLLAMFSVSPTSGLAANSGDANNLTWDFNSGGQTFNYLALGESLQLIYTLTVNDGNGGTDTEVVTITLTGTNDAPVLTVDAAGGVTEDASSPNLTDTGTLSFTDADTTDTHLVSKSYNGDAVWSGGSLSAGQIATLTAGFSVDSNSWDYSVANAAVQFLGAGETVTFSFNVTVTDDSGALNNSDTEVVTITLTGSNDDPEIRVESGDGASVTIPETNSGLTASDTLTVTDIDAADTVSTSIALTTVTGNQASLSNAQLLAMFSVTPTSGLAANAGDLNNLTWNFNSGSEAFNYLAVGQNLTLTYTLTVDDGQGGTDTQTVTVTINGTADGIMLAPVYTGDDDPNNFDTKTETATITGTNNNDLALNGTTGADTILALDGNDTVNAGNGGDTVYGGNGADTINGGSGNDFLYGQAGNDIIHGDDNNDEIWGGSGDDQIFGDANNDQTLWGGSGTDTIQGGAGNDVLAGGFGADSLNGGTGNDRFVYLDVRDRGDTISGWETGDRIDLSAIDANPVAGDQGFAFGGTTATANGVWYAQIAGNTVVYVDTDGDTNTAELWLTLNGTINLTGGDFLLGP